MVLVPLLTKPFIFLWTSCSHKINTDFTMYPSFILSSISWDHSWPLSLLFHGCLSFPLLLSSPPSLHVLPLEFSHQGFFLLEFSDLLGIRNDLLLGWSATLLPASSLSSKPIVLLITLLFSLLLFRGEIFHLSLANLDTLVEFSLDLFLSGV